MNPTSNGNAGPQASVPKESPDAKAADQAGQSMPLPPINLPLPPAPPQASSQNDNSTTLKASTSEIADDGDLIEKEWVHKAKQIVEANRNDPYKQSEELTVFKADYMKKRYNKNIKLSK